VVSSQLKRVEAVIQSMTPQSGAVPKFECGPTHAASRRGAARASLRVNDVLKQFQCHEKMMQEMGKMQKAMTRKGALPKMRLGR